MKKKAKRLPANQAENLGLTPWDPMVTIRSPSGAEFKVNEKTAPQFEAFLRDLEATGYVVVSSGGYSHRRIYKRRGISQHAYGNAIDIDAENNPIGTTITNLPPETSELARKHGLSWGMEWRGRKDPMHFEVSVWI